ncbi:MAG: exodeoxyribonuclease VII large subunit [Gammaproteobacteria bacterium]|nr:exodeoxyribonuclease VII large subunit [Gammaproteobacteria bacterium]
MQANQIPNSDHIYTVSRLNNEVKSLLEGTFPFVWVEGEISNFAAPHSGHWYFGLKDAAAQVRCAMFRGSSRKLTFVPKDGMHVMIKARVSLYENRGEFQLIAEDMEERGEGALRRAFEVLKKKLLGLGLFDPAHKKPLPPFPKQIGIVTSATGAAIRDVLTVLARRNACIPIIIYPTLVQGALAAKSIAQAITTANERQECDVLIVTRGGGSLEDLWAFNEELVAHAMHQSQIPIISGVGHEVDFTIADFIADVRAATPSAAAELVARDAAELLQILHSQQQQIDRLSHQKLLTLQQHVTWLQKHLAQQHPKRRLQEKAQLLDFYELSLVQHQTRLLNKLQTLLKAHDHQLHRRIPTQRLHVLSHQLNLMREQINNEMQACLLRKKTRLANAAATLDALSPLATLQRGFSIVSKDHQVVKDSNQVALGDQLSVRLQRGRIECKVVSKEKSSS